MLHDVFVYVVFDFFMMCLMDCQEISNSLQPKSQLFTSSQIDVVFPIPFPRHHVLLSGVIEHGKLTK